MCELPQLFGPIDYWVRRAAGLPLATAPLFDKRRKEVHRYTIADVNGPLTLTVPIVKPHGLPHATWADVALSDHGQWWHIHRTALESAYGRTPFFEFYIDRFAPLFSADTPDRYPSILHYIAAADSLLRPILLPTTQPSANSALKTTLPPYWQPRADRLGFIPGLSILDLIFCLGPEAAIYLRNALA